MEKPDVPWEMSLKERVHYLAEREKSQEFASLVSKMARRFSVERIKEISLEKSKLDREDESKLKTLGES